MSIILSFFILIDRKDAQTLSKFRKVVFLYSIFRH